MSEHTQILSEFNYLDVLPSGFDTTITDTSRLRSLENQDTGNLNQAVAQYDGNTLDERQVIDSEVSRIRSAFLTPERTMELPCTSIEYENGHIHSFASEYKESDDTPTGTIKSLRRAQSDDLVFTVVTPEVLNVIAGNDPGDPDYTNNFILEDVDEGERVTLVGDDGFNSATDAPLDLADDERLFFTGDIVDLAPGQSILTRHEWVSVDGKTEDYGPMDTTLDARLSGSRLGIGTGAQVKRNGQLDAKAYEAGDAEPWPVAFYMAPGHQAPTL